MHEAKTHLSRIIREVHAGESVLIKRGGEPMAVITPYSDPKAPRKPGSMREKIKIEPDFDNCDEAIEKLFLEG